MNDGAQERGEPSPGRGWPGSGSGVEFDDIFGKVSGPGSGLESDLADLAAGAPWRPVGRRETCELLASWRLASGMAGELRGLLLAGELTAADVPDVRPDVDGQGHPVVTLVQLSAAAVAHLAELLRGSPSRPVPPATGGNEMAA